MGQEVYRVSLSDLVTRESREATMLELSETGEYTSQRWECWSISHEGAAVGVCHIRPSYSTSTLSVPIQVLTAPSPCSCLGKQSPWPEYRSLHLEVGGLDGVPASGLQLGLTPLAITAICGVN